jgi:hypothetical protein
MTNTLPQKLTDTEKFTDWNEFFGTPVCRWKEKGFYRDGRFLTQAERIAWLQSNRPYG